MIISHKVTKIPHYSLCFVSLIIVVGLLFSPMEGKLAHNEAYLRAKMTIIKAVIFRYSFLSISPLIAVAARVLQQEQC